MTSWNSIFVCPADRKAEIEMVLIPQSGVWYPLTMSKDALCLVHIEDSELALHLVLASDSIRIFWFMI